MAIVNKKLAALIEEEKKQDIYWVEEAKFDFALMLEKQRQISGLSLSDLAKKIATSPAYITKVFRGDSNLTIESLVKLARATGGELEIKINNRLASQETQVQPQHASWQGKIVKFQAGRNTTYALTSAAASACYVVDQSANHDRHELEAA